ncbi:ankyrin [Clavulina sp. PMI_390]|nr:ankyrin [Clavulina sp. PMI_390]
MITQQKRKDDRIWLAPSNPHPYQEERLKQGATVADHAQWFLDHESFQKWLETPCGFFWVSASAGVGKSVLCSEVVKCLQKKDFASPTALAFFYFDYKVSHPQIFKKFLASIVDGFSQTSLACRKILKSFEKKTLNAGESELISLFHSMLDVSGSKFLVIDALDECEVSERTNSLLPFLRNLKIKPSGRGYDLRVFVTSRPEPDIQQILDPIQGEDMSLVTHRIRLGEREEHRATLAAYIEAELGSPRFKDLGWSDDTRAHVKKELLVKSNSMFLWVYLQLQELGQCTAHEARQMLTTLPTSLDHTYARILNKIAPRRRHTVQAVLECIVAAPRPFTVNEIQEIFLLELNAIPDRPPYLPVSEHSAEGTSDVHSANLFKLLPGLLTIENDKEVHFIHFTVQEYLLSGISDHVRGSALQSLDEALSASMLRSFGTSHEKANAALLLVCLSVFETAAVSKFPNLVEYAIGAWFIHAKLALPCYASIAPALAHFLNPESGPFKAWVQRYYEENPIQNLDHPLHWAVRIGSVDEVRRLLNQAQRKGVEIGNVLDAIRWTPICYAACAGDTEILSTLIETNDSWTTDHVGPASRRFTLMHLLTPNWTSRYPYHRYMVLDTQPPHSEARITKRIKHPWPLNIYWKEKPHYLEVLRLLCDAASPASLFAGDAEGFSPLELLLESIPDMEVVKLFLEKGADPRTWTRERQGVAHAAARSDASASMIQSLVNEHGIDIHMVDVDGFTPLHAAVEGFAGPECVRAFLDLGANPNVRDNDGMGTLDLARIRLLDAPRFSEWGADDLTVAQEVYNVLEQRGAKLFAEAPGTTINSYDVSVVSSNFLRARERLDSGGAWGDNQ